MRHGFLSVNDYMWMALYPALEDSRLESRTESNAARKISLASGHCQNELSFQKAATRLFR